MREGTVAHVVEQGRGQRIPRAFRRDALPVGQLVVDGTKALQQELHDECGSDRMGKPRMLRAGERQGCHAQLAYTPKALHFGRVHETRNDFLFLRLKGNETVNRIAKNHRASLAAGDASTWVCPTAPSS
jgi:hypothetical protein